MSETIALPTAEDATSGSWDAADNLPGGSTRLRGVAALAVVLVMAGGFWLSAAFHDLPYIHHPDEPTNLVIVNRMVDAGDPNPRTFIYPSLFYYLHACVHLDGPVLGWLGGEEDAPVSQVRGTTITNTPGSVKVHRAVSVVIGLVTVAAVYASARLLTRRAAVALFAAAVMATSTTLAVNAQLVTPDGLATALVAATLWASVRLWRRPTWASFLSAGALVGLAASAKYNALPVAVTVTAAAVLGPGFRAQLRQRITQLLASSVAAALTFLATTPYALLDRGAFVAGLRFQRNHYATGHAGMEGDAAVWYAKYLLTTEVVLVVLAVVGAGIALAAKRWQPVVLLSVFPVIYGAVVATQAVRNERTILLLLPNLAVLAALGGAVLVERLAPGRPGLRSWPSLAVVSVLVVGVAAVAVQAVRMVDSQRPRSTTWAQSREWIEDNIPEGSSFYIEGYSPWIDPTDYEVQATTYLAEVPDLLDGDWSYLVASETTYGRFVDEPDRYPGPAGAYRRLFERTGTVATFEGNGPTILILEPAT